MSNSRHNSKRTNVEIPEGIDGYTVTGIAEYAFWGQETIKKVHIPDTVTEIGSAAFENCYALQEIDLPEQLEEINRDTFNGCSSLTSLDIPDSVTMIDWRAFKGCASLVSVTIPDSVVSIGDGAFDTSCPLTLYGYYGTEAQRYADKYGFTFRMIAPATSDEVSVDAPEGYTYSVVKKATDDEASPDEASPDEAAPVDKEQLSEGSIVLSVYDITLRNKGDETPVQPESPVTVRIRCDNPGAHVFRREADRTLTDMHARYENGYLVYEADHFSVYLVVQLGAEVDLAICGDADGDGDVTIIDVTLLLRYVAQMDVSISESTLMRGDVDGNGELEVIDATYLQRYLADMDVRLPIGKAL